VTEPRQAPDRAEGQEGSSRTALLAIGVVVAAGLLIIALYGFQAPSFRSFCSIAGFGVAAAGASLLVGGLAGLLFGIPRRLQQELNSAKRPDDEGSSGSALYGANTNLEQISDWLTKILVGVGLTQISQINKALSEIGDVAAKGMGDFAGSKAFSIAIIVYFTLGGFLLGYLWTRLYLGRALTAADTYSLKKRLDRFEQDARALRAAAEQLSDDPAHRPTQEELQAAINAASPEARSHIFYRAQYQRWRNWRDEFTKPIMERTIAIFRALAASDRENEYHANYGELGYALKDQRKPDWKGAEEALSRAIAIRGETPAAKEAAYELNRAICRIMLDEFFHQEQPTSKQNRSAIETDIKAGIEDEWAWGWAKDHPVIVKWLRLNKVDIRHLKQSHSGTEHAASHREST
jgi:hypothetical protein